MGKARLDEVAQEALDGMIKDGLPDPIILDPKDPREWANCFLRHRYGHDGGWLLRRHKDDFYRYDGTHWPLAEDAALRAEAYEFLGNARVHTAAGWLAPFKPKTTKVNDFLDALKAVTHLDGRAAAPRWITGGAGHDAAELVPMQNGLLHLPSGELLPPTPALFNNHALPFPYDPDAPEPKEWLAFLRSVWPDDAAARGTLQEVAGYLISGDRRQQKLFLLVGPPRGGKGTIGTTFRALLGVENVAGPTLASLGTNFGLAPLIGKSAAIISDARLGGRTDAAVIAERLLSISGEDAIGVDRKFRDTWTGNLPTRFLVLTNELPRIADASGALSSRFIVLTMNRSFLGREDRGLGKRLLAELPGIFNWAVQGWRRLSERGRFVMPASSASALEDIEALSSPILAFLKARCVVEPGASVQCSTLYLRWCAWSQEQGRRDPGTRQTFGRDLRAAVPGLAVRQSREGDGRVRDFEGVREAREEELSRVGTRVQDRTPDSTEDSEVQRGTRVPTRDGGAATEPGDPGGAIPVAFAAAANRPRKPLF